MIIYQRSQVSQLIRFKIDAFDDNLKFDDDPEAEIKDYRPNTLKQGGSSGFKVGHIVLGTVQKLCSFEQVSADHKEDPAFSHFYNRFRQFLWTRYILEFESLDGVLDQKFKVRFHNIINPDLNAKPFTDFRISLSQGFLYFKSHLATRNQSSPLQSEIQ
jgi:hypothetical protein